MNQQKSDYFVKAFFFLLTVHFGFFFTSLIIGPSIASAAPPQVITVPQVPTDLLVPHETWSGEPTILKGIARDADGDHLGGTYYWEFGDGDVSPVQTITNADNLAATHTYSADPGTLIIARLHVTDTAGESSSDDYRILIRAQNLDVEVNKSIDDGLWWLYTNKQFSGSQQIIPTTSLFTPDGDPGLLGEYYDNYNFNDFFTSRVDSQVNFYWVGAPISGMGVDSFSIRWSGEIDIKENGYYQFATRTDDGVRLFIDNQLLINDWENQASTWNYTSFLYMSAGRHDIVMEYYEAGSGARAELYWNPNPSVRWQNYPASDYTGYYGNSTASAVQAFEINGHHETGDSNEDPYVGAVLGGIDYLLSGLGSTNMTIQGTDSSGNPANPDTNSNGIGLSWSSGRSIYETGAVMDAFVATGSPDAMAQSGGANVLGRRYQDIVQDMVDMYAWGQHNTYGGWRYNWEDWPDNSAAQWGAIGMIPAENNFGCTVPQWVKDRNNSWLINSYNGTGFGYTGSGNGWATTPSGMVQLAFDGFTTSDSRWQTAENWLANSWSSFLGQWNGQFTYGYYAFTKALRLALPQEVTHLSATGLDWYGDETYGMARHLVNHQNSDGSWNNYSWLGKRTATAWDVIILTRTLFEKPPVAIINAAPNPGAVGQLIHFDASGSYHVDPAKEIVDYLWDFDASDGVDFVHPDALGVTVDHAFGQLQDYTVSLKVLDNSTPVRFDTSSLTMHVTIPPHPPTAVMSGPYLTAVGEEVQVDGSGSYDIDEPEGDSITAWDWESDFIAPYDFAEATGETAILPAFTSSGRFDIALRVTDNTATVFPQSAQPDLTNVDYGEVAVYNIGVTGLSARPKYTKCQLLWSPLAGATAYRIFRSEIGPNEAFRQIGTSPSTYASFLDHNLAENVGELANTCASDLNDDAVVDADDEALFALELGRIDCDPATFPCLGDFDEDLDVDGIDAAFIADELGRTDCMQVTGIELDKDYWYRIFTEINGEELISYPIYVYSQGRIINLPPVISSTPITEAVEEILYEYDVEASDPEGSALTFLLDLAPDGMTIDPASGLIIWTPLRSQWGVHDVMIRVTDGDGISATQFFQIEVSPRPNDAPIAVHDGPYSSLINEEINFDASGSYDPEGDLIVDYHWVFGDGSEEHGIQVSHTYTADGIYTVTLYVTDDRGATGHAETSCQVELPNTPPIADPGGPYTGAVNTAITFDGSASYDADNDPLTYTWNFGDSTPPEYGVTVSHVYTSEGLFNVSLSVDDGRGGLDSAGATVNVTPPNQPPTAAFSVTGELLKWQTLTFDGSVSSDPESLPLTNWQWDFGDGLSTTGTMVSHAYADPGDYTVSLTVTDDRGATNTTTQLLSIAHPPNNDPVIDAGGPYQGAIATPITLTANGADPDGDTPTYTWTYDGDTYTGTTVDLTFDTSGSYTVMLTADDGFGGNATDSATVIVYDPAAAEDEVPPQVSFATPAAGDIISGVIAIEGTASDDHLTSWLLEYAPVGSDQWTEIASGNTSVTGGLLGQIDAGTLTNDFYRFRLTAYDANQSSSSWIDCQVNDPLQLGRFVISYEDLAMPLMGMDLSLTRSYDSSRNIQDDFGAGWTLDMKNADIREDASHNVFITLPDGRRVAFAFTPVQISPWFPMYEAKFTAPPGVYDELDFIGNHSVVYSGGDWYFFLDSAGIFNPETYVLRTKTGLTYTINQDFGINRIEDRIGNFMEITTDGITTNTGRNVTFARDGQGRITNIIDPAGQQTTYTYDGAGDLVQFTDQNGNVTTYVYGSDHYLLEIQAPDGHLPLRNEYYPDGRLSAHLDSLGNRTEYSYNPPARQETVTDPNGHSITYTYDSMANVVEENDSLVGLTSFSYDANGNLLERVDPSGRKITFTYDGNGNKLSETRYTDSADPGSALTRTFTYNSLNQVTSITNPLGDQTLYTYDADGNPLTKEKKNSGGTVLFSESWTYDGSGNRLSHTNANGQISHSAYNAFGDQTSMTDAAGLTTSYEYDTLGRKTAIIDGLGQRTSFTYDGMGNLATVTDHDGEILFSLNSNHEGQITSRTDANGTDSFAYTGSGNLSQVTDSQAGVVMLDYNNINKMTTLTNANGVPSLYDYDGLGRMVNRTDPLGNSSGFSYDAEGYISGKTLADGASITFDRDDMGRLVRETKPEGTVSYTYDENSRITQMVENYGGSDLITNMTYNAFGWLASVTDPNGRTVAYEYDTAGNRTKVTAADGTEIIYTYDAASRLHSVQAGGNQVTFSYNAAGQRQTAAYSNGVTTTYGYDSLGRLDSILIKDAADTVIASYDYTIDSLGNRTGVTLADGSISWALDNLNRLTGEDISSTNLGTTSQTFSYDNVGNRFTAGTPETYNTDNSLHQRGATTYSYDPNGNMTTFTGGPAYSYDSASRLTGFSSGTLTATYQYDSMGRRTAKTVAADSREYLYDNQHILSEYLNGTLAAHYVYSNRVDEPLMTLQGGSVYFYHADGQGNVVALTDSSGNVVQRYGYDAWGQLLVNSGSFSFSGAGLVNTFTYTGREYDAESGLYHYRTRAYDPALGRFLQRDGQQGDLTLPQSLNLYSYVMNNPVTYTDPSGQTALVSYVVVLSYPSGKEVSAALAGFLHGFSTTNIQFLASYMELIGEGYDIGIHWYLAMEKTKIEINKVKTKLGGASYIAEKSQLKLLGGIPEAFKGGVTFKVGFKLTATWRNLSGEREFTKEASGGGFENGVTEAFNYLNQLAPF
ncbi:MAG: PKD domain-containing protein [Desulfobulbaceae bacterium]|nr:PKD domain-containing protein [Desulfobulbaceae bacterium]